MAKRSIATDGHATQGARASGIFCLDESDITRAYLDELGVKRELAFFESDHVVAHHCQNI